MTENNSNKVQETLMKGDKVLNVKTGRMITVGSASWKALALEGLVSGSYKQSNAAQTKVINQSKLSQRLSKKTIEKVSKTLADQVEAHVESDEEDLELLKLDLPKY
jgi:hypothetical protein